MAAIVLLPHHAPDFAHPARIRMSAADLFISYAREDRERVQRIADELARRGYSIWWDKGLRTGEDFHDRIEEMLDTARGVVVVWSRHSIESEFVRDEARRGHKRRVLLPVFIDPDIDPPLGFGGIHTTDLSGWIVDPSDAAPFDAFAGDVAAVLGRTPEPVAPLPPGSPRPSVPADAAPRKPGLLPLAIGGATLVLATTAVYLASRGTENEITPPSLDTVGVVTSADSMGTLASTDTSGDRSGPADPSTVQPVRPPPQCTALSDSAAHPLDQRRRARASRFAVDTVRHLLLDARGEPVPGGGASSYGPMRDRRFIVVHFSAAPPGAAERYFQQPDAGSSAHVMIDRDGGVRQMLPFDLAARHAGDSQWRGVRGLNSYSIGIDMENWGRLTERQGRWYPALSRQPVPADEVQMVAARGGTQGWHKYTTAQLDAFLQVSCALRYAYPGIEDVVGHDSISPGRRADPGPAFPITRMRARLFPTW